MLQKLGKYLGQRGSLEKLVQTGPYSVNRI